MHRMKGQKYPAPKPVSRSLAINRTLSRVLESVTGDKGFVFQALVGDELVDGLVTVVKQPSLAHPNLVTSRQAIISDDLGDGLRLYRQGVPANLEPTVSPDSLLRPEQTSEYYKLLGEVGLLKSG